jgi:demethylmenaquinone methyltransferase/2-methoxy-6-polyprenyl-1,4-benzoquinol methylase
MGTAIKPYKESEATKKEQVADMFNSIATRYDFLNHFFSMGIDILWRKRAIRLLRESQPKIILDLATGTGDFAISARKLKPEKVYGVDISQGMLEVGRQKIKKRKLDHMIEMKLGDSEELPFETATFDALTVGFGVRNYEHLEQGLGEMLRVLKPEGTAIILEFSKARKFPVKQLYSFYFNAWLPFWGKILSKDNRAYTYLPESVEAFPEGQDLLDILAKVGYREGKCIPVSGGIASIYIAKK